MYTMNNNNNNKEIASKKEIIKCNNITLYTAAKCRRSALRARTSEREKNEIE